MCIFISKNNEKAIKIITEGVVNPKNEIIPPIIPPFIVPIPIPTWLLAGPGKIDIKTQGLNILAH